MGLINELAAINARITEVERVNEQLRARVEQLEGLLRVADAPGKRKK